MLTHDRVSRCLIPDSLTPDSLTPDSLTAPSSSIAIIGAGYSGTMVAVQLIRQANAPLTIQLIDRRTTTGRGVAYSTACDHHLLNVPAGKMSAFPDQPDHFLHWLQQQSASATAATFAPRQVYGEYVQAVLAEAMAEATADVRVDRIVAEAVSLQLDDRQVSHQSNRQISHQISHQINEQRAIVSLSTGEQIFADRVVLALGNFAASPPPIANPAFYQSRRYFNSARSHQIAQLASDDPVLIIGTGLTALDAILTLQKCGHRGQVDLISRHGLLPHIHQPIAPSPPSWLTQQAAPQTARALLRQVRQRVAQGHDWRSVVDSLRPVTQQLWQALPLVEQRRCLRHLRPYWDVHRHRMAPQVAEAIGRWQQTGQLTIHAGRVQDFCEDAAGVTVQIRKRNNPGLFRLRVKAVINCTGPTCDYRQVNQPLITQLLQSGLAQPDALRLGLATAASSALLQADGTPSPCLYTLGSPQRGRLWETTAVPELRGQAQTIAQTLLAQLAPNLY